MNSYDRRLFSKLVPTYLQTHTYTHKNIPMKKVKKTGVSNLREETVETNLIAQIILVKSYENHAD